MNCETEVEIDELFAELSDGVEVFMPLDSYPFSEKFGVFVQATKSDKETLTD